jgi:penicillin amidase
LTSEALALRWSAHEVGETAASVFDLAVATSVAEAESALARYWGPPLNFVLADVHGSIGYAMAGGPVPVRRRGDGSLPVPGRDTSFDWVGWVPPAELPRLRDPERGFVVTANNRIAGDDYGYVLGSDCMNGYRARRIEALLEELDRVTVEDCRRIQLDQVSLPGLELAAIAGTFEADDPLERRALELLAGWDGHYGPESAAGAVYGVLMRRLQEEAYSELGPDLLHFLGAGESEATAGYGFFERTRPAILQMLAARDASFFTDGRTWDGVFHKALAETVAELGADPAAWRWGKLHQVLFEHPFNELPVLGRLFSRGPFPAGGDNDTVWQMAWPADRPYGPRCVGPSMRAVYDMSDPDANHVALATGQSGQLGSPHYDDFVERWRNGELVPLALTRTRVDELAGDRLVLLPAAE